MPKGNFLCGCPLVENPLSDEDGFPVCPIHRWREYGWRSPLKTGPYGQAILDYRKLFPKQTTPWITPRAAPPPLNLVDSEELGRKILARSNGK